ncbi:MAG TPA: RDD family protein [Albitalea sp.]|nr:RDD family protein [Albitalea sp.]
MSSVPEANLYAPPAAHVEDIVPDADVNTLGGRGARLGAALIDSVIGAVAAWSLWALTPVATLVSTGAWSVWRGLATQTIAGLLVFALIHGWLLARRGQTLGKLMLKLRIVRSNGERASLVRLLGLRYAIGWAIATVPFIGALFVLIDCLLIFRESRQCLHDNIADTIVVVA